MRPIKVHDRQRKHKLLTLLDLTIIIAVAFGLAINMTSTPTIEGRMRLFTYFTVQTNTMMLLVAMWAILADRFGKIYHYIRVGVTLSIFVTGLAYHFLLAASHSPGGMDVVANALLHYSVPLLALVSWFAYMRLYGLRWWAPFGWLLYPLLYIGGVLLRGNLTGDYPYWFLDPVSGYPQGAGSLANVGFFALGLAAAFLALGALMSIINNLKKDHVI